ncbi:MAG: hypothetical protein ABJA79_00175 [Parafilimonas sp.]
MQHINKDIDELFRKAAENYPLQTDNVNWDKIYSSLNAAPEAGVYTPAFSKAKKRFLLATTFLLLLLISGLFVYNYSDDNKLKSSEKKEIPNPQKPILSDDNRNPSDKRNNELKIENITGVQEKPIKVYQKTNESVPRFLTDEKNMESILNNKYNSNHINDESNTIVLNDNNIKTDEPSFLQNLNRKSDLKPANDGNNTNNSASAKTPITLKTQGQQKLYIGLIGSPDISTIKYQSINKIGVDYGILAGYKLNKHLNIELSIVRDHKHYFTNGKYFSTDNLKLKESTTIEDLSGYNRITEVPVCVRYNFLSKKNSGQFFTTIGGTTLFVHEEKYDYDLNKAGRMAEVDRNYKRGATKVFSNLQLSAGYEAPINKLGNIRIEPYYKLPVQGVGIGELHITSFGVNIGITKNIRL